MKRRIILTETQLENVLSTIVSEQISDAVTLRKMSYKSIIPLGKFKGMPVQQVLDLGHTAALRWIYYNVQGLSFTDEVLRDIKVIGDDFDYSIKKPGTDPELGDTVFNTYYKNLPDHTKKYLQRKSQSNFGHHERSDRKSFSKDNMRRKNHGN